MPGKIAGTISIFPTVAVLPEKFRQPDHFTNPPGLEPIPLAFLERQGDRDSGTTARIVFFTRNAQFNKLTHPPQVPAIA
jgi:hypothetical protein